VCEGLSHWIDAGCTTVIVSSTVAHANAVYAELNTWFVRRARAGRKKVDRSNPLDRTTIIRGIKSADLMPGVYPNDSRPYNPADLVGWTAIAAVVQSLKVGRRAEVVVIDNESMLHRWVDMQATINHDDLEASLRESRLNGVALYTPWMGIAGSNAYLVVRAFCNGCRPTVIDPILGWPNWRENLGGAYAISNRNETIRVLGDPNRHIDQLFCTSSGEWHGAQQFPDGTTQPVNRACYRPAGAMDLADEFLMDRVIVYPGIDEWASTGKMFVNVIRNRAAKAAEMTKAEDVRP